MAILKDLIVNGDSRIIGNETAESFIKNGGTSSQFLKADGSVDSNAYATVSSLSDKVDLVDRTTSGSTCPVAKAQGFYDEDNGHLYALPDSEYEHDTQETVISLASEDYVYNSVNPAIGTSQPPNGMIPNKMYNLGTLTGSVTFTLASPTDNNIVNHYYWTFDSGSTAPTITWPAGITWNGGSAPTINASKHYEISVLNSIGSFMEV